MQPKDTQTEPEHTQNALKNRDKGAMVPVSESTRILQLDQVRFRWPGQEKDTLQIDQLAVYGKERVFIYGPSGCGKSTLLSLMAGVLVPDHGSVRVSGFELSAASSAKRDRFRADHIGFVFQQFNLLPYLSVLENVLLSCRFSHVRRNRLSQRQTGAEEEACRLLSRLEVPEALWHSGINQLSIGQQQRVAVARAMIGSPSVIIADEPTSALDRYHRDQFLDLLTTETEHAKTSLIFVSHDEALQPHFSRTLFLPEVNASVC